MSRIKIKHFGPIIDGLHENEGWIDIKKVTLFIGNQGSGKSTIAKLISTLTWIEKALVNEKIQKFEITRKSKFQNIHCAYQGLKNYFNSLTYIEYEGDAYFLKYSDGKFTAKEIKGKYLIPKIMYVPAERNFLSVVSKPTYLSYLPKPLYTFLDEFERSKKELNENLKLPINNLSFAYEPTKGISRIFDNEHNIELIEASSGLQSLIPLFLVSKNLSEGINKEPDPGINILSIEEKNRRLENLEKILQEEKFTKELKNKLYEILSANIINECFINIVEEPEQNLFPSSQKNILYSLLEFNNQNEGNKLIMTTHSPYIINYLSIAIQADSLKNKIFESQNKQLQKELNNIFPIKSIISGSDVVIYQMNELKGTIQKLPNFEGIPSDKNYLNESLADGNRMFDALLEIEEKL